MAIDGISVRRTSEEDEYDRLEQYEKLADLFDEDPDDSEEEDDDEESEEEEEE